MPKKLPRKRKKAALLLKLLVFLGLAAFVIQLTPYITLKKASVPFCANSTSCITGLSGKFEDNATTGVFMNKDVKLPPSLLAKADDDKKVLGDTTTNVVKQIYVDLTTQHLYAFENNKMVYDFLISSGKWGPTPTGVFNIWVKLRYTRMTGGNKAIGTYYNLPNVPYTMFFYNKDVAKSMGYSIHGAYWHNNFGHPMSHGCVNMKTEEVAKIYEWANPPSTAAITYATNTDPGTQVIIYGDPPKE